MTTAKPVPNLTQQQTERFWSYVVIGGPNECWEWTGWHKTSGYGCYSIGRKNYPAHRISFALTHGDAKRSLDLDHLCRNRGCVNPAHLEPVTRKVNLDRGVGNGAKTHCPSGHSYVDAYREKDGSRKCRTCVQDRARERYRAKRSKRAA